MLLALLLTAALPHSSLAAAEPAPCVTMNTANLPLATRKSPLDSVMFSVGAAQVRLCYGRPSVRGRTMLGGEIAWGKLWRTGANEPTMIHTTGPIVFAGVAVPAGSYSIYTMPGQGTWHIIVNRSITQWGHESSYSAEVKKQEVGHGMASSAALEQPVEMLTFEPRPGVDGSVDLVLTWEKTSVSIPIEPGK
ncbi:MAG: DUF2911 domain-containing protein [Gemmatimonadota bacterium]|nr:DUF2911 domain-containing protein [Gemmatimonadota bacterium]